MGYTKCRWKRCDECPDRFWMRHRAAHGNRRVARMLEGGQWFVGTERARSDGYYIPAASEAEARAWVIHGRPTAGMIAKRLGRDPYDGTHGPKRRPGARPRDWVDRNRLRMPADGIPRFLWWERPGSAAAVDEVGGTAG